LDPLIAIIITILVIGIISAIFLIRGRRGPYYSRRDEAERFEEDGPAMGPASRPRPQRMENPYRDTSLTSVLIGAFRALIGLAAVLTLVYIFNSTRESAAAFSGSADVQQYIKVYTEGAFRAIITIGVAVGLYIFTRFVK
jgi:hypothetical protein